MTPLYPGLEARNLIVILHRSLSHLLHPYALSILPFEQLLIHPLSAQCAPVQACLMEAPPPLPPLLPLLSVRPFYSIFHVS